MQAELEKLRNELDEIDSLLVQTLGKRFEICRSIAAVKQEKAIPMMQSDRIRIVMQRTQEMAKDCGMRPEFIRTIYETIISESCRIETKIMSGGGEEVRAHENI
jgi:4-amino-4-deoxychorismate mutase